MELLTAADSEQKQRSVAGALRRRGITAGDRVVLHTTSGGAMLSAILGALRVGVVPVLLNAGLLEGERAALTEVAEVSLVIDDAMLSTMLAAGTAAELAPFPLARPMHFTSGTTGEPKGVWSGLLSSVEAEALSREEAELWEFDSHDRHLVCSPFHHSVSIRFGGGTLLAGGSVIIPGPFDAAVARKALLDHRPTTTFMVPAHLQRMLASAPSSEDVRQELLSLRLLVHAGAPCPPPLKHQLLDVIGPDRLWEFYGSTEGQFTACSGIEWLARPGTVGRARAHRSLTTDADGTIWCQVPHYGRFEYWRDPVKTAASWRDDEGGGRSFTVRDLGRLDEDDYLFIDGRRDDLIITGGVNVYPAEIEAVLGRVPGVAEVAVFGVDDERWGQRVCAAVRTGDGGGATELPTLVLAYARTQLAPYKCPKDVFVVTELPLTSTGKVQRLLLPELLGLHVQSVRVAMLVRGADGPCPPIAPRPGAGDVT